MKTLFIAILLAAIALSAVAKFEHHQAAAQHRALDANGNAAVQR